MTRTAEQSRVMKLKQRMKTAAISALLVTKRENVRYLTGFTGSAGSVLVAAAKPWLITDFRYMVQAEKQTTGVRIHIQKKDFPSALKETAEKVAAHTVWFDESSLTLEGLKKIRKRGLKLKGSRDLTAELRQQKGEEELKLIREAIRRAEESFRELKKYIRPGAHEQELAIRLEFLMREKGAKKAAFDSIIASGTNGAMPHASVTNRRLKHGDMVTFDFGAEAYGYFSDITRTYCLGTPTSRQREIHALVQSAQAAAIKTAHQGVACREVDDAARSMIRQAGHGEHFGHGTGHGIGLMVHEGPSLSPLSRDYIAESMVFTVEPGVYIPGWGGVRIEDMVFMTANGPKVLTSLPRELDGLRHL